MREFMLNKTKKPIIHLICKKVEDETDTSDLFSLQEQLSDAKGEIDDLKNTIKDLTKQLKRSQQTHPLPVMSPTDSTEETSHVKGIIDVKEETIKSEASTIDSNHSDHVSIHYYTFSICKSLSY